MPEERLELSCLAAHGPKPCLSTNSSTPATEIRSVTHLTEAIRADLRICLYNKAFSDLQEALSSAAYIYCSFLDKKVNL